MSNTNIFPGAVREQFAKGGERHTAISFSLRRIAVAAAVGFDLAITTAIAVALIAYAKIVLIITIIAHKPAF